MLVRQSDNFMMNSKMIPILILNIQTKIKVKEIFDSFFVIAFCKTWNVLGRWTGKHRDQLKKKIFYVFSDPAINSVQLSFPYFLHSAQKYRSHLSCRCARDKWTIVEWQCENRTRAVNISFMINFCVNSISIALQLIGIVHSIFLFLSLS